VKMMTKILAGTAGLAAIAAAAPASAQYYPNYGYSQPYGYNNGYSGYGYNTTANATQRCTAAVQARLNNRYGANGIQAILGAVLGANTPAGRVLSVTSVNPNRSTVRVRGLATSGRVAYNNYGPYGVGAYGSAAYAYQPDLSFKCDVDYRGYVRDVDINRR
jgi:hypothetical protein